MTLLALEQSQRDGKPVELFLFKTPLEAVGTGFTNATDDITFGAETYTAAGISRSEPTLSAEEGSGNITIEVPRTLEFARQFIIVPPGDRYSVTLYRRHVTDSGLETVATWKGFISQVIFEGMTAKIVCKPLLELVRRRGPRMTHGQPCQHVLYDSRCTVNETLFRTVQACTAVDSSGTILTITGINTNAQVLSAPSAHQGAYWIGGFIKTPDNVDHRLIVQMIGSDQIRVQFPFFETPVGVTMTVTAGCNHSKEACNEKFSNILNRAGHDYLPDRNIFTQGLTNQVPGTVVEPSGGPNINLGSRLEA